MPCITMRLDHMQEKRSHHLSIILGLNKKKEKKRKMNVRVFTLTCDVCSPSLAHVCMNMGT